VEYSSQLLGEYIPVIVYLPPCYSEQKEYPVLYLLHGKPQDENHWLILGVDEVVNRRINAGRLSDLILVMPEQPEPLFSLTDGGPGSYEGELLSTLLPFIEANYAASDQPDRRALAGISRGGVWALEIGFSNPEMFAGVGGLSPALNVNDARQEYDPLTIAESVSDFSEFIFIASGDVDSAAVDTQRLHTILVQREVSHRYTTVPGGHEGGTWAQLVGEMVDYLTQDW
jgi:enterochelin esterase-like enzyme